MSYHQTYEFLALDRPLRADELAEIRKISGMRINKEFGHFPAFFKANLLSDN